MREKNCSTASRFRNFGEKFIARVSRRGFDRQLPFGRERANVRRSDRNIDIVDASQFFNEARIGIAGATAKLMIQMTNNQFLVTRIDQPMQKRDRIASA